MRYKNFKTQLLIITVFLNPHSYKTENKAFVALISRFTQKQLTLLEIMLINTGPPGPVLMQHNTLVKTSSVHLKQCVVIVLAA